MQRNYVDTNRPEGHARPRWPTPLQTFEQFQSPLGGRNPSRYWWLRKAAIDKYGGEEISQLKLVCGVAGMVAIYH